MNPEKLCDKIALSLILVLGSGMFLGAGIVALAGMSDPSGNLFLVLLAIGSVLFLLGVVKAVYVRDSLHAHKQDMTLSEYRRLPTSKR